MKYDYYVAKIGNLWVNSCFTNIGKIHLSANKKFAIQLTKSEADWVKENTNAEITKVSVTIEESVV